MSATEEHSFRQKIATMATEELESAIDRGTYDEPYFSIAKANLLARAAKGSEHRDSLRIFLQGLHVFVAYLALIVAILAFFKS